MFCSLLIRCSLVSFLTVNFCVSSFAAIPLSSRQEPPSFVRVRLKSGIVQVPVEKYLKGVLPSEMPSTWPIEALKAQAVAARTYVFKQMSLRKHLSYDVEDSVMDQVYNPQSYARLSPENQRRVDLALEQTAGLYLLDAEDGIFQAFFHADCGGRTESAQNVWGVSTTAWIPSTNAVDVDLLKASFLGIPNSLIYDEGCELNQENEWQLSIALNRLQTRLAKHFGWGKPDVVLGVQAALHTDSGRVHELQFYFQRQGVKAVAAQIFRQLFGFARVKSTNFQFEFSSQGMSIKGKGRGHGVGLCQSGSRLMALAGNTYSEILQRYYPEAQLSKASLLANNSLNSKIDNRLKSRQL